MDCTPYPHYYDLLMPFILLFGAGLPAALVIGAFLLFDRR